MNSKYVSLLQRLFVRVIIVFVFSLIIFLGMYIPRIYNILLGEPDVLTIYTPQLIVSPKAIEEFEKKTGIRVVIAYFDTNEEMFAKFKISKGEGYDVVVPSDYMVELLTKENLLQPLDHSKISNISKLDQRFLGKYYDTKNAYSLPLSWIPYGIGFNKKYIQLDDNVSWDIVFKKDVLRKYGTHKVAMLNDAREAIFLSSIYLFGDVDNFSSERLDKIVKVLIDQKTIVEAYAEAGAKYLLVSEIVPMAVIPAARMKEIGQRDKFGFVIPREGSLIDILNVGIPVGSKKAHLAHKLIDFLLSKEIEAHTFRELDCNPSNEEAYFLIDKSLLIDKAYFPLEKIFDRLHILNNKISPAALEKSWFLVKSA